MVKSKAKEGKEERVSTDPSVEVNENLDKKIESELVLGYREFNVEDYTKFKDTTIKFVRIYKPTIGQETELDSFYARKYAEHLRDGTLMTRKEMEVNLTNRGIDVEALDTEIENCDKKIASIIEKIMAIKSDTSAVKDKKFNEKVKEKIDVLAKEREVLKIERSQKWSERENLFIGTIESLSDQERILKKLVMCIKLESGEPVWSEEGNLREERDTLFVRNLTNEALYYWIGITPNFFEDLLGEIIGEAE